jgi:hypothetical protein
MKAESEKYQVLVEKGKEIVDTGKHQLKEIEEIHQARSYELSGYFKDKLQEKDDEIEKVKVSLKIKRFSKYQI